MGEMDGMNLINSANRELDDLNDLINNWDKNDIMFPNIHGVIPPPARNYLDTPAWSVDSNSRGMGTPSSSSKPVSPAFARTSKQLEDKLKRSGRYHLEPAYPSSSSSKPVSPAFARTSKQLEDKLKRSGRYHVNPNYFASTPEQEAKFFSPRRRRHRHHHH